VAPALDTTPGSSRNCPDAQFQVYGFNTSGRRARQLLRASAERERSTGPFAQHRALNALVPQEGTSLVNAFAAVKAMSPLPTRSSS